MFHNKNHKQMIKRTTWESGTFFLFIYLYNSCKNILFFYKNVIYLLFLNKNQIKTNFLWENYCTIQKKVVTLHRQTKKD